MRQIIMELLPWKRHSWKEEITFMNYKQQLKMATKNYNYNIMKLFYMQIPVTVLDIKRTTLMILA